MASTKTVEPIGFQLHEAVEVYSASQQQWVAGIVVEGLADGGVRVQYGASQKAIPREHCTSSNIRKAVEILAFQLHEAVEVYSASQQQWVAGVVAEGLADGGVRVQYGASQKAIPREHCTSSNIRKAVAQPTTPAIQAIQPPMQNRVQQLQAVKVGSRVKVCYHGTWYKGSIVHLPEDASGRYTVQCDVDAPGTYTKVVDISLLDEAYQQGAVQPAALAIHGPQPFMQQLGPNSETSAGQDTLCLAASVGNLHRVQALLGAGACINTQTHQGVTPLFASSMQGHVEVVQQLIAAKADVNKPDDNGVTPLTESSAKGNIDIVKVLVVGKADVNKANGEGTTPVYMSAQGEHIAVLRHLVAAKANVDMAPDDGQTPVSRAAQLGHESALQILIAAGADLMRPTNDGYWTALKLAKASGHTRIEGMLQQAGAQQ